MKVALYVRVSTPEQAEEGYSVGEQKSKLKKYCEIKDWDIVRIYSDPGFSGSNLKRPSMQQLIKDAGTGLFDALLVYKLDRLSRSQKDTLYLIEDVFQKNGIHFISLSENFDTSTPFGKASIGILSVFAQLEREQIKERMMMGKVGRAKAGKSTAWSNIPFGYIKDKDTYIIDPLRAGIVKDIYRLYLDGLSITRIWQKLNEEGHIGKDVKWSYRTVRHILGNETYTGVVKFRGKTYPSLHRGIISKKEFDEVQRQLKIRQIEAEKKFYAHPFQAKYMLSGLLKCGYCNATLAIHKSHRAHKSPRWRYTCPNTHSRGHNRTYARKPIDCELKFIYRDEVEATVLDEIKKLALDPSTAVKKKPKINDEVDSKSIKKELAKIKRQQDKLVDLYLIADSLNLDELNKRSKELKSQQEALQKKLGGVNNHDEDQKAIAFKEALTKAKDIDKMPYDRQKFLVNQLVKRIDVTNGQITISWNF